MPPQPWYRRKPPWWPDNEAWPPADVPHDRDWQGMRGGFFRRLGCFLFILMLFAVLTITAIVWAAYALGNLVPLPPNWSPLFRAVVIGMIGTSLVWVAITALVWRRLAAPIGDLLEAAGRIEGGDYSVRVAVGGPQGGPQGGRRGGPREVRALGRAFNSMASELQSNDEQRRMLLADVTHELRTPITVIQGNLEGLLDGIYPLEIARIQSILEETQLLSRTIDDLRTLSLADAGALTLQRESTEVTEMVRELAASFDAQASANRVQLALDIQPGLPPAEVDPIRIREVFRNLLTNALRYTPPGGEIILRGWTATGEPDRIWLEVQDSGSGIAALDLPHIFDRFYKSSDSRGTGLGLAICKRLVQAHGGEILATSEPGHGTAITFWLPLSAGEPSA